MNRDEVTLEPMTRVELYFAAIAGEEYTAPDPMTRIEVYLDDILKGNVSTLEPMTRVETYLAKISGADVDIPDPMTRVELFLAAIAGENVTPPQPMTRLERWLAYWIENGVLPSGYRRILGLTFDNNVYYAITGFKLKGSDTVRISFSITAACNVFGCYQGTDASDNYDLYASTVSGSKYFRYGNGTYLSYWSITNRGKRFDVVYTPTGSSGMPEDSTWTEMTFTAANDLLVGATTTMGTSAKLKGTIYGAFVVDERLNLVPCERMSDHTLGYYDTISKTFYEPTGSGVVEYKGE